MSRPSSSASTLPSAWRTLCTRLGWLRRRFAADEATRRMGAPRGVSIFVPRHTIYWRGVFFESATRDMRTSTGSDDGSRPSRDGGVGAWVVSQKQSPRFRPRVDLCVRHRRRTIDGHVKMPHDHKPFLRISVIASNKGKSDHYFYISDSRRRHMQFLPRSGIKVGRRSSWKERGSFLEAEA